MPTAEKLSNWMPPRAKVLSLTDVTEMIANAQLPEGATSMSSVFVEKVDDLCRNKGYTLTPEAKIKVDRYRQ